MAIPLTRLYSAADDMLKQASIHRENNNISELYIMLLRFASLVLLIYCVPRYIVAMKVGMIRCRVYLQSCALQASRLKCLFTVNISHHKDYIRCPSSNARAEYNKKLSNVLLELEELKPTMEQVEHKNKLTSSGFLAESMDSCLKQLLHHGTLHSQTGCTRGTEQQETPTITPDVICTTNRVPGSEHDRKECGICLEEKPSSEMFSGSKGCPHNFCSVCMALHITNKINERTMPIMCPKPNCREQLLMEHCQTVLCQEIIEKWGLILAEATIPDSKKCYCPYPDCGSPLINDEPSILRKTECPSCKRAFCAQCRVPWHKGLSCSKFEKSSKRKEENKVFRLARKKKWKQCRQCKCLVERISGCHHMTCRCGYQFCYKCGARWMSCNFLCRWRRCLGDR